MRVCLFPTPQQVQPETGVGRVIIAQAKYLPAFGVQFVNDPNRADLVVCHISRPENFPRVDILQTHGLYWHDLRHNPYLGWHNTINRAIIQTAREALAVVVPSDWVAMPWRRDMRLQPWVIGHGIDLEEWKPGGENLGYIFWGKNRNSDSCDPVPAYELAKRGLDVISTFLPPNENEIPTNLRVTGLLSAGQMHTTVACADVYLATTMETFGIGTLEALACGIPVLGYDWGGTRDIVRHGVDGFLVDPGDYDGLIAGYEWIRKHRADLSANAIARAKEFTWEKAAEKYAALFQSVLEMRKKETRGVSVVVPCYNYGRYISDAVASLQAQIFPPEEIIIVDDCSEDDSREVIQKLAESDSRIIPIFHQVNCGVAASRNDGIARATQPFIVCLDADDMLKPEYLEICSRELHADRALGVVYTSLEMLGESGARGYTSWPPEFDWNVMTQVTTPPANCIPSAAMFRKAMWERAGGYQQVHAPGEDTEFWVRGLSVGFNARKVSNDTLFVYRTHANSASRTKTYQPIDHWHPWMRDKIYPMGAPDQRKPVINSYAMPLVSVIIPVGPGHDKYLPAALDSLLGQTFRNWEVIAIDDTGGKGIADWIFDVYPFVRWTGTRENHAAPMKSFGAGAARNIGLEIARAPLCLFLDADDYLDPEALKKMIVQFAESDGRYVYTDWVSFEEEGTHAFFQLDDYAASEWVSRLVSGRGGLNAVTVLMATADARRMGFDEKLPAFEDSDFFAKCAVNGIHGVRLAEPLFYYRTYSGQRRLNGQKNMEDLVKIFHKRYEPYLKGEKKMTPCCGGSAGQAVMAVKRQIGLLDQPPVPEAPAAGNEKVKMEFIGSETGAIMYRGESGEVYKGANNPLHRFKMVRPEDVGTLERTGKWKRVASMAEKAQQAQPVMVPPAKTPEQLRREAEEALLRAKQALEMEDPLPEGVTMQGVPGPIPEEEEVKTAPEEEPREPSAQPVALAASSGPAEVEAPKRKRKKNG